MSGENTQIMMFCIIKATPNVGSMEPEGRAIDGVLDQQALIDVADDEQLAITSGMVSRGSMCSVVAKISAV